MLRNHKRRCNPHIHFEHRHPARYRGLDLASSGCRKANTHLHLLPSDYCTEKLPRIDLLLSSPSSHGAGTITAMLQSRRFEDGDNYSRAAVTPLRTTMERGQVQSCCSHAAMNRGRPDTRAPEAVTAEDAGPAHRDGCRDGQCIRTRAEGTAAAGCDRFNPLINIPSNGDKCS